MYYIVGRKLNINTKIHGLSKNKYLTRVKKFNKKNYNHNNKKYTSFSNNKKLIIIIGQINKICQVHSLLYDIMDVYFF